MGLELGLLLYPGGYPWIFYHLSMVWPKTLQWVHRGRSFLGLEAEDVTGKREEMAAKKAEESEEL